MTSKPEVDGALLAAHDLALTALREITPENTIGDLAGYTVEDDGVVSLRFDNRLAGYPGWFWTVSVGRAPDAEPTVLEVELLPGDTALLAPEWVPWAVRLAEYHAAQAAAAEAGDPGDDGDTEDDLDDDLDDESEEDVDDLDVTDFDSDGSPILHAGDVDGVDIDELDDADADDADEDDDDDDESDDDADDESDDDDDDESDEDADEDESDEDADEDESDDDDDDDDESDDDDVEDDSDEGSDDARTGHEG
jgi:hypothetical protein